MEAPSPARPTLVRPRIYLGSGIAVGPGKIDLLRQIAETRSISAAARVMGMTYKRAWLLIDSLNQGFGEPVVEASAGGKGGGGAHLTLLGESLVARYCSLETALLGACTAELDDLQGLLSPRVGDV